jgi:hypothetical protein
VDARPSTKPPPAKDKMNHGHQIVKIVMDGTGCKSVDRVQEVLHDVHGDTDAAIEFLIAEQASGGDVSPACSCERIPHSPEGSGIYFPPSCKVQLLPTHHNLQHEIEQNVDHLSPKSVLSLSLLYTIYIEIEHSLFWTSCYLRIIRDGLVIGNR